MTQYVLAVTDWLDFGNFGRFFRDLADRREHNRKVRSTIKELSRLTDRELNDIGLGRGDIWAVAHGDDSLERVRQNNIDANENLKGWV